MHSGAANGLVGDSACADVDMDCFGKRRVAQIVIWDV